MDLAALRPLLDRIAAAQVACVGDLMVDRYVYGEVSRISPEAPIPVLARRNEKVMLGAVGNVARNVAALGARARLVGVVGDDAPGHEAVGLVAAEPRVEGLLATAGGRATTVKTRFVAGAQQLLRLDHEDAGALDRRSEAAMRANVADAVEEVGAVLLSDYAKGAVTPAVVAAAHDSGAPVIVDPKGRSFARYGPAALIKPNAAELALATDRPTRTDAEVEGALAAALAGCEAQAVLVTRAGQGMTLMRRGEPARHFRTRTREVFDVSGAGDTVLAALGAALAAGASLEDAVELALLASGVVVGKAGTAVATPADLIEAELAAHVAAPEGKVVDLAHAAEAAERWRSLGLKVGLTNGVFDVLHRGHVAYLAEARGWCDRLIVGVNSDSSVRALKGPERPVNDLDSRSLVLAGLSAVDLVVAFGEPTPIRLIEAVRPDVLVKGADYQGQEVVGARFVESYGGELRLAPLVQGYSSTKAIERMKGVG
jgi:D-beta-D-heptose 7-phosphate kinase/D-beta-D-heptose 1-phosphate adenosyltransferase